MTTYTRIPSPFYGAYVVPLPTQQRELFVDLWANAQAGGGSYSFPVDKSRTLTGHSPQSLDAMQEVPAFEIGLRFRRADDRYFCDIQPDWVFGLTEELPNV